MPVEHVLTRGAAARREAEAIHHVVKTEFKELEENLARHALAAQGLLEEAVELQLAHAVLAAE